MCFTVLVGAFRDPGSAVSFVSGCMFLVFIVCVQPFRDQGGLFMTRLEQNRVFVLVSMATCLMKQNPGLLNKK